MTIDWSLAPVWAHFAAAGPYGSIWYELEPVLIYADPPYYVRHGDGQWQRISYAPRNARLFQRVERLQGVSDA